MCVITLAYSASATYRLIVAANRDESHARATLPAAWWPDAPHVCGGRDAEAGGTWLAIGKDSRLAAVTNLRDEPAPGTALRSRGRLVSDFVTGTLPAARYVRESMLSGADYAAFNLLLYDGRALHYASNRAACRTLTPGVHAFSNALPDAHWPKVTRARRRLEALVDDADPVEALFAMLAERAPPPAGVDARQVSLFQLHPVYGTRSSTVILVAHDGRVRFIERSFDAGGAQTGEVIVHFTADPLSST